MPKKKKSNRGNRGRKLSILGGLSECSTKFRESDTKFETRNKSDGGTKEVVKIFKELAEKLAGGADQVKYLLEMDNFLRSDYRKLSFMAQI